MCVQHLRGRTVLIIEPDIESALALQDRLVDAGAIVLTAYRQERALELVNSARLTGVIIDQSVYIQTPGLRNHLRERTIPHVVHCASEPVSAVVGELGALVVAEAA